LPGFKLALLAFIVTRIALSAWVMIVRQVYDQELPPDPLLRPYVGVEVTDNPLLEPWQRWDTLHYQAIAERGYQAFAVALFTPPLLAWVVGLVPALLGISRYPHWDFHWPCDGRYVKTKSHLSRRESAMIVAH
jgi:hypothetical protein